MSAPRVAVVGPGGDAATGEVLGAAERVGALVAGRGWLVLTGGLDGVMAAAARGAREAGGHAVGLLPGGAAADGNPYLDLAVPTGLGQARNVVLVTAADAVIAVGGSWGTLSEIALAMRLGRPVVCLLGWQVTDRDGREVGLTAAATPEEAVAALAAGLRDPPFG